MVGLTRSRWMNFADSSGRCSAFRPPRQTQRDYWSTPYQRPSADHQAGPATRTWSPRTPGPGGPATARYRRCRAQCPTRRSGTPARPDASLPANSRHRAPASTARQAGADPPTPTPSADHAHDSGNRPPPADRAPSLASLVLLGVLAGCSPGGVGAAGAQTEQEPLGWLLATGASECASWRTAVLCAVSECSAPYIRTGALTLTALAHWRRTRRTGGDEILWRLGQGVQHRSTRASGGVYSALPDERGERVPYVPYVPYVAFGVPGGYQCVLYRPAGQVGTLREQLQHCGHHHRGGSRLAGATRSGQPPGRGVIDESGLGHVDVAAVGGEEPRRGGVVGILADEFPLHVGPVAQP